MPIVREIPYRDPVEAAAAWADKPYWALLDSASTADAQGRYSYLAVEPFRIVEARDGAVSVDGRPVSGNPFEVLERELARFDMPSEPGPVPFTGGAVGFLGYELARHLERLPARHDNHLNIPDMVVGLYDIVIAFDMVERRAWVLASGHPATGADRQGRAEQRAGEVLGRLDRIPRPPAAIPPLTWTPELSPSTYRAAVSRVLAHIEAGDVFQVNFTSRHLAPNPGLVPFDLYRRLRRTTPAPFAAYLGCGPRLAVASASPERFLSLRPDGRIEARPIKGTRPRGADPAEDDRLRQELATSAKDRAENLMIVDLLRNDIGRVAEVGSVSVRSLSEVESFAQVHHLVSVIEGRLSPGLGPVDLLRASFPGGSVTGAPKIRAMEIIDALEASRRGPYCGIVAWIGFDGAMDSSIVIRTVSITPEWVVAQAGGGIVADSDPAGEYEEMMVKIRPLLAATDGSRS